MKKTFLALGLIVTLASCGAASKEEATAVDSTKVAVDTTAVKVACDSAKVDTAAVVK